MRINPTLTNVCASIVFLLSFTVLLGWAFGIQALTSVFPSAPPTTPLTALIMMLMGFSLVLADRSGSAQARRLAQVISVAIVLLVIWLGIKYLFALPPGVELLFFRETLMRTFAGYEGRPSPHTLFSALLGCSALLVALRGRQLRYTKASQTLAILASVVPWLALFGYTSATNPFYQMPDMPSIGMSPITSIGFLLLAFGVLGLNKSTGVVALVTGSGRASSLVRVLLLITLIAPLLLSWLLMLLRESAWFGELYPSTLDWGVASLLLIALVLVSGSLIYDRDVLLAQSEQRYERLVDEVKDYAIIMLDQHGIIASWNQGARQINRFTQQEVLGQHFSIFYEADDRQAGLPGQLLEQAAREGRAENEGWRVRKDGSRFWVNTIITPQHNTNGELIGFVKVTRDLTSQRRLERELEASARRFQTFLLSAPDAIIIVDREGRIVFSNQQANHLFQYTDQELRKMTVEGLLPESFQTVHSQHRESYWAQPKTRMMGTGLELSGVRKDGTVFPVEISLSPIASEDGIVVAAAVRDITASKIAKQEIEELNRTLEKRNEEILTSNKELEAFSFSVSHDLRAPLRAIAGFSRKLVDNHAEKLDSEARRLVDVVIRNASKMGLLIDDILAFSRLGRTRMSFTSVNLNQLFDEAFQTYLQNENPSRKIEIKIDKLPEVLADRSTLQQAINNLVSNALKYTRPREKTVIDVGLVEKSDKITIYIKDNGVGFDSRHENKLFEVFQRLHSEEEFEGSGVGLAIVRRVARRHNGEVWGEGVLDKGATFYMQIPKNQQKVESAELH